MEERVEILRPSVIPYYGTGLFWLLYALLFPMLQLTDFLIVTVLSVIVFFVLKRIFKTKVEVIYRPVKTGNERLDAVLEEGSLFLQSIRASYEAIDNEPIRSSISRIDRAATKILDHVKTYPSKLSIIRRFMNYYLPTIAQLLTSYDNLENQEISAQSIQNTMQGIEDVMAKAADAFEHQLEALFASDILDIDAEIKVLENMMKQQGLFQSDFETLKINKEKLQ